MPAVARRSLSLMITGLALFAFLAAISLSMMQSLRSSTVLRARVQDTMLTNAKLLAAIADIDTGQRGYVMTGNPEFLGLFSLGLTQQASHFRVLKRQAASTSAVSPHLRRIKPQIVRRVEIARQAIDRRGQGNMTIDVRLAEEGKDAMDRIRAESAMIESLLGTESQKREQHLVHVTRLAAVAEIALGIFGSIAIVLGGLLLVRERRKRFDAEFDLHLSNRQLEARVSERTQQLEDARSQLETFAAQLDQSVEAERRRLAREVHDQLGQVFTALKLSVSQFPKRYSMPVADLALIVKLLDEGIAIARRIAGELRPPLLDDLGLAAAIEFRGERFQDETGIDCLVEVDDVLGLTPLHRIQLFRIVQEALTNVARHSGASHVLIAGHAVGEDYDLVVEDDGRGMQSPRPGAIGMVNMSERAALAGGRLLVGSGTGGGVRIQVSVPLEAGR